MTNENEQLQQFPLLVMGKAVNAYMQRGFVDGGRWRKCSEGDYVLVVCYCGCAVKGDSLDGAVDQLRNSYAGDPSAAHTHNSTAVLAFPEFQILKKHPRLTITYGCSSEDQTWWADAREGDCFIACRSRKRTLAEALRVLGEECDRWEQFQGIAHHIPTYTLRPLGDPQMVSYGTIEEFPVDDTAEED